MYKNIEPLTETDILSRVPVSYEFSDSGISTEKHTGILDSKTMKTAELLPELLLATQKLSAKIQDESGLKLCGFDLKPGLPQQVPVCLTDTGFQICDVGEVKTDSPLRKILNLQSGLPPDQVKLFLPEVVYEHEKKNYINYHKLLVILVEAIKELNIGK